jgi:hypothetical protein
VLLSDDDVAVAFVDRVVSVGDVSLTMNSTFFFLLMNTLEKFLSRFFQFHQVPLTPLIFEHESQ